MLSPRFNTAHESAALEQEDSKGAEKRGVILWPCPDIVACLHLPSLLPYAMQLQAWRHISSLFRSVTGSTSPARLVAYWLSVSALRAHLRPLWAGTRRKPRMALRSCCLFSEPRCLSADFGFDHPCHPAGKLTNLRMTQTPVAVCVPKSPFGRQIVLRSARK